MITIEHASRKDLTAILELQKLCYQENALRVDNFNIPPLKQTIGELEEEFESSVILKAHDEGNIIGSIRAYEKSNGCYIGRVIVHPDYQNRGIGKALMRAVEELFDQVKRYWLFTGEKDDKNIHFYTSMGYSQFKKEEHDGVVFVFLEKKK